MDTTQASFHGEAIDDWQRQWEKIDRSRVEKNDSSDEAVAVEWLDIMERRSCSSALWAVVVLLLVGVFLFVSRAVVIQITLRLPLTLSRVLSLLLSSRLGPTKKGLLLQ